jgi:hypothetical protein
MPATAKTSVQDVLTKADMSVQQMLTDGGYLEAEQSDTFIQTVQDQPTLINSVRVVKMRAKKRKIDKVGFGSRILRAAPESGEALEATDRSRPDFGQIELDTKEILAEIQIPYDVLEDNIEGANFQGTLLSMIGARASIDLDELLILGDTTSADTYLALTDGLNKQITSHTADAGANPLGKVVFTAALKLMPFKYRRNPAALRWYCSGNQEINYRNEIWERATPIGDRIIEGTTPVYAYGIPVMPTVWMPDATMVLTFPKNIVMGIHRDIMVETAKDIRRRVLVVVLTMRVDYKLEEEDATVRMYGIDAA